jgi:hypothetical protein
MGGLVALLFAAGLGTIVNGPVYADLWTVGKVYLSADKQTYIEWDGSALNFVVAGSEVFDNVDLAKLDGVTCGTATASKVLCIGASKEIATITSATITTLTAPTIAGTTAFTGAVTTTDGVASGTARKVGGLVYSATSASDNLLASAGASAHVDFAQKYAMPANTLNAGTVIRVKGSVNATDASGTDTLEVKVLLGTTALTTSTAFDPDAAADFVRFDCTIVGRAAAGAAAAVVAECNWTSEDGTTYASGANILATTNFATNGALDVKASAKWSSTTANTNARLETFNVWISG